MMVFTEGEKSRTVACTKMNTNRYKRKHRTQPLLHIITVTTLCKIFLYTSCLYNKETITLILKYQHFIQNHLLR